MCEYVCVCVCVCVHACVWCVCVPLPNSCLLMNGAVLFTVFPKQCQEGVCVCVCVCYDKLCPTVVR